MRIYNDKNIQDFIQIEEHHQQVKTPLHQRFDSSV